MPIPPKEIRFRLVVRALRLDYENRGKPAKDCPHCRDGEPCRVLPFCRLRTIAMAAAMPGTGLRK